MRFPGFKVCFQMQLVPLLRGVGGAHLREHRERGEGRDGPGRPPRGGGARAVPPLTPAAARVHGGGAEYSC